MKVNKRKIIELYEDGKGLSISAIREVLGYSRNTIRAVLNAATTAGISASKLAEVDDSYLDQLLRSPAKHSAYKQPDFEAIQKELDTNSDVNLKLCWYEYHRACLKQDELPYLYSRFCDLYRSWSKKTGVTRRIIHRPGYALQVDYAGSTGCITDRITGEEAKAYFFVATLPYSGKMYVDASPDMKMSSWIASHVRAFRFFGGLPRILVIDNLKTGVSKPNTYEPVINETYSDLARYYDVTVVPAKVAYPKGKAQVERTVSIIQTWIIAYLRHKTFFTFTDLNEAVLKRVYELNAQILTKQEGTRELLFEQGEKAHLRPLPKQDFELAERRVVKLAQDAHFQLERQRYSAPHTLIGSEPDVRITSTTVEAFKDGQRVCQHRRLIGRIGQYSTKDEHMPDHLRASNKTWSREGFMRWATKIGPNTKRVIEAICDSRKIVEQAYRSCRGVLALAEKKGASLVEKACAQALELGGSPSYTQIRNIANMLEEQPPARRKADELNQSRLKDCGIIRDPDNYHRMCEL
jgi:transposase